MRQFAQAKIQTIQDLKFQNSLNKFKTVTKPQENKNRQNYEARRSMPL